MFYRRVKHIKSTKMIISLGFRYDYLGAFFIKIYFEEEVEHELSFNSYNYHYQRCG